MPTEKELPVPGLLSDSGVSEDEIREKARHTLEKSTSPATGLLALGGILLGANILNAALTKNTTRFKASPVTTARDIGESIRLRRKDLGLTQKELAARSGTGDRLVSEIEHGKETAETGKVLDLLDALDLEVRLVAKG